MRVTHLLCQETGTDWPEERNAGAAAACVLQTRAVQGLQCAGRADATRLNIWHVGADTSHMDDAHLGSLDPEFK